MRMPAVVQQVKGVAADQPVPILRIVCHVRFGSAGHGPAADGAVPPVVEPRPVVRLVDVASGYIQHESRCAAVGRDPPDLIAPGAIRSEVDPLSVAGPT